MGQAAVDLPDPLGTSKSAAPPRGAAGTDDLLSQLAGEEINRLLAEADLDSDEGVSNGKAAPPSQAPPGRGTSAAASTPNVDPVLDAELDDLMTQLGGVVEAKPPPHKPTTDPRPPVSAELDQVFEQMTAGRPSTGVAEAPDKVAEPRAAEPTPADVSPEAQPVPEARAPEAPPPVTPGATATEPSAPPAESPVADVGQVLDSVVARDEAAEAAEAAAASESTEAADAPTPEERAALHESEGHQDRGRGEESEVAPEEEPAGRHVRLLRLVNAPWASVPRPLLDAAGKIAILTLFNSLAVLLYVLLFRHK